MVEIIKMILLAAYILMNAQFVEGFEIRLLPTNLQGTEGFVEIFYNGSWGFIGNPMLRFSDATATLLCETLNLSLYGYGAGHMRIENNTIKYSWLQTLECNGNESSIDECVETDQLNYRAYSGSWYYDYGSKLYCVDYKLTGGLSQNTGMLLTTFSGSQHTICYESFDSNAGDVVCKHLRYNGLVNFTDGDPGLIPLVINKLTCTGNESSLNECTMSDAVIDKCTRAVYITCKAVRLTTWNEYNDEGAVEIFYNGSWGYVGTPEHGFNDETSKFLCKTFGFRNGGFSTGDHSLVSYDGIGWLSSLSCDGTEADIMQCVSPSRFSLVPSSAILNSYKQGTWLYCFDFNITSIRLVNGSSPNEGEVELQIGGRWGSICMYMLKTYHLQDAGNAVCKILGYVGVSEILNGFVNEHKHYWMWNLYCDGDEINLTDCSFTKGGYRSCIKPYAVKCEDTDQCQSNPCLNYGTCVDGDMSYTCTCTERWSGINCEIDLKHNNCQEQSCDINSTCIYSPAAYTCVCTEGYNGDNCAIDIDECLDQPCENNGACVNKINGFVCHCDNGYEGYRCQNDKDECLNQPCENNGACINAINGFVCHCDDGYEGYRCQNEVGDQQQVGDQTTLILVLISLICVLSIVVLATVCCCLRYRRKHKKTKSDASNVLNSGQVGLQNTKEVETVQKEMEEGQYIEDVYDGIKENTMTDVADYINPVNGVELPRDDDGYVKFADNDQSVGYYKLKHTKK